MERRPGETVPVWRLGTFQGSTFSRPWGDLGDIRRSHIGMLLLRASGTRRYLWDGHDSLVGLEDNEG